MPLMSDTYGKGRVRVMRVHRDGDYHQVSELSLAVMLTGAFSRAYTHADNSAVIATDSIKNIVNIVARENIAADPEHFTMAIADRFLTRYPQVDSIVITARETRWSRLYIGSTAHAHGFVLDANGIPTIHLERDRGAIKLRSGIDSFTFMKSTASGWTNYVIDEYTTLPETTDRIAATSMNAAWLWAKVPTNPTSANATILHTMLEVFATTYSFGIQDSLYRMAEAALAVVPEIIEIKLACPNKHYIPINLTPFGLFADNLVFTPTDEPHGQIECTVAR